MRNLKWISLLTIFALLFAMFPATTAEEIDVELANNGDESVDIELDGDIFGDLDVTDDIDISGLSLDEVPGELGDLDGNLLNLDLEEQAEQPAAANADGDFEINENGVLVKYRGFDKNVVIPDGVTKIGDSVFQYDKNVESITIPDSVTAIDYGAFFSCPNLKSVIIPDSVTSIANSAFFYCSSLISITIPNSVTSIGQNAFDGCSSLTSVQLSNQLTTLPYGLFIRCSSLVRIDIPNSVTSIANNVFLGCDSLESVTIPASVTEINRGAFGNRVVVIYGTAGSYAERFANGMGFPFNAPIVTITDNTCDLSEHGIYDVYVLYLNYSHALNAVQKPIELAQTLTWSSTDTSVVTVDQNGNMKAVAPGNATIIAATEGGTSDKITVLVPKPSTIDLSCDGDLGQGFIIGRSLIFSASADIPYQYYTKFEMPITWFSSDSTIISIESTEGGKTTLKGNNLGKATITATTPDGGAASVELEVVRPVVESVSIDQSGPITLHPGEQCALTITYTPADAAAALTWRSNNNNVATVDENGMVTAVAEGSTTVYVTTDNGCQSSIDITVAPLHPHPESIRIDQSGPITLYPGQKCSLTTTLTPADAEAKRTWYSNNTDVATVSQDGVITAVAEGWAYINVETDNGCEDSIEVIVRIPPKKITLNKSKATLAVGDTLTLKTTITPDDAETGLTWSSSAPKVAKVSNKGKVTALKPGKATITVKTDNGKTAKATITVKPAPKKVKLNKAKATLKVKEKLTLKASLTPSNAYTTLTWTSSNKKVATVNSKGVVTAKKAGTAVITVRTKNGKTAKATITVK